MIEVVHDLIEALGYLVIPVQVTASEFGVLLAEEQGLRRLERRLVVQALWVGISLLRDQEDHQNQTLREKVKSSPHCHSSHRTGENSVHRVACAEFEKYQQCAVSLVVSCSGR